MGTEPPTHQRIDDDCQEQFAKQAKLLEVAARYGGDSLGYFS